MIRNLVLSAAGAGLVASLVAGTVQLVTTEPLILSAEVFENAGVPVAVEDGGEAWSPAEGLTRAAYTFLANLVLAVAVALMLLAAMAWRGDAIDAKRGLAWGLAGFAAASLLPALGLPPELPGTPAADLAGRQVWWLGTAVASALGLYVIVFGGRWVAWLIGLGLLVLPHVIGAPQPPTHEAAYPAGLAGQFVVASMVTSAVLWSLAGLASGWLHRRLSGGD